MPGSSAVIHQNGVSIPAYLDQAQLHSWLLSHPRQAHAAFFGPGPQPVPSHQINEQMTSLYGNYLISEAGSINPSVSGMIEAGLWLELDLLRPGLGGPGVVGPALQIPPMPTWAMITVIAGWIVGWSAIGAWRMVTRDA